MTNRFFCNTRLVLSAVLVLTLSACSGVPDEKYTTVTLNGTVQMTAGPMPPGILHLRLYNLWSLDGDLRHPLQEIEDFESDSPTFSHTFEYPLHMGEGLAVHAWLDTDGDGIYCTPTSRLDPGGLAYTETTPEGTIDMTITLSANCRAANWFYPPAP